MNLMDEAFIIKTYNEGINAVIALVNSLLIENACLKESVTNLMSEKQKLNQEITEIEARLNKNSINSGKPPSSDSYKKPRNSRKKTGNPTGGQWGHEGKTLEKV